MAVLLKLKNSSHPCNILGKRSLRAQSVAVSAMAREAFILSFALVVWLPFCTCEFLGL